MSGRADNEVRTGKAVSEYARIVARQRPYGHTPERRSIRFAEFRQLVRRYRPSDLLPALGALALVGGEPPFSPQLLRNAPPWAIALAARESILWGNEYRREGVTADDLRVVFNAHNSIHEGDVAPSTTGLLSMLTRLAYEQFPYQESIFEEVSRSHALLVDGIGEIDAEVLDEGAWHRLLGAPLGQIVGATFFLQVAATKNSGWFDHKWLDRDDLQPLYARWPRHVIEQRAEQLSSSFEDFRTAYESVPHPPIGYERYAYNPLVARPFVRMADGRLLAPQPRLVLRTVSPSGLYYRGIKEFGTPFARDLARLTERYVGEQLASIDDSIELHPEIVYGKPEQKSIDWFLVLPSVVIMFEVKSARSGLLDRAAVDGFESRAKILFDKAITQLERSSEALDNRLTAFAHIPPGLPRIGIIVTGEPYYLANSTWMRDLLKQVPFPTLTASLRGIEFLAGLPLHEVERQLVEIANDPERSTWNLGNAIEDAPEHRGNKLLQRAWDSYPWLDSLDAD